jgi:nucleoside-diphosphate-sugar epimerase
VTETLLRTSTAIAAGDTPLARTVYDELAQRSIAVRHVDLSADEADARASLEGVASLVLLDVGTGVDLDGTGGSELDLAAVRSQLRLAADAGVSSLVVVSSAMVYGAHDDNPVPLTEDAAVRPSLELPYAMARVELERLAAGFRRPGERTVAILRPAVVVGGESSDWLRSSAWGRRGLPADDELPPRQFVHVDDLAHAVTLACEASLDGVFNVAPDGWIAGDTFRELVGAPLLPVPARLRRMARAVRNAVVGSAVPPGVAPYTRCSWVIASDRLRAAGWKASQTSEEAFVEADRARGWRALSPRARQELSLGVVGAVLAAIAAGVIVLIRRSHRR